MLHGIIYHFFHYLRYHDIILISLYCILESSMGNIKDSRQRKSETKLSSYAPYHKDVSAVLEQKRSPRKKNLTMGKTVMIKTVINMVLRLTQIKNFVMDKKENPVKTAITCSKISHFRSPSF